MSNELLVAIFVLGLLARTFTPWIIRRLESDEILDWKFVVSQLLGGVVAALPLMAALDFLTRLNSFSNLIMVFAYGWFSSDIGREIHRQVPEKHDGNPER